MLISPTDFEVAGLDDGQRLVEPDRLALLESTAVDVRRARQAHLATGGEHVDGVVLVRGQQHAVTAGRLTQPVDLLAEREQLLTGLLEGVHQLRVARRERVDPRLELVHVTGATQSAVAGLPLARAARAVPRPLGAALPTRQRLRWTCDGGSERFRTLGLTHVAPLPAPKVGAVTTSTLPAIQSLCAV